MRNSGLLLVMVGIWVPSTAVAGAAEGHDKTLESIIKAWTKRQAQFKSWDFSASGSHFYSKALIAADSKAPSPDRFSDFRHKFQMRFVCEPSKKRLRFDYRGKRWDVSQRAVVPFSIIDTFDGNVGKAYFPDSSTKSGYVHRSSYSNYELNLHNVRLFPYLIFFQPLGPAFGLKQTALELTANNAVLGTQPCCILRYKDGGSTQMIWVDQSSEYLPLRYAYYSAGRQGNVPRQTVDVQYIRDKKHGRIPISWVNTSFLGGGKIGEEYRGKVTKYTINTPIPASVFDIQFPSGSWVENEKTKESYILKPDGRKRYVMPGEYTGDNIEELRNTDPYARRKWIFIIAAIVIAVIGMLVAAFYLRRRFLTKKNTAD